MAVTVECRLPAPALGITAAEAIAHRLRRVYLPLFTSLLPAWGVPIVALAGQWPASAAIGRIPGIPVTIAVFGLFGLAGDVALRPRTWRARGELRSETLTENSR